METKAKIEIISRKAINPFSPTSPQCRNLKFSLLDQIVPPRYTSIILFYTANTNQNIDSSSTAHSEISNSLQKSLSKTLVHFYPFAGRLKDNTCIECSDEGAYFIEARINCQLSEFIKEPDPNFLSHLLPTSDPKGAELVGRVVLLIQLTVFKCGGTAVSVCASHKIADASSMCEFIKSWAAMARDHDEVVHPEFIGASMMRPTTDPSIEGRLEAPGESFVTKRFVFDVSKLANLKAKIGSGVPQLVPTNVELVSAIFLRCAIAACQSTTGCLKPSLLYQTVNLRTRMVPPVPEAAIGNLIWGFPVVVEEASKMEVGDIVVKMRKGLIDFCNEKANRFKGEDGYSFVFESFKVGESLKMGMNMYFCSSWCKFPFYEVDFGWGKPTWITCPMYSMNAITLMDTKRGERIEAWVTLEKQEMAMFETNEELLAFASINPSLIT
ncbi:BAHD acyltransferase [Morus notabilis]|uniref:BAHD acyltransferase n=2 Tax=Morus notabilis TaxID=981085 RepID=W9QQ26_9ROSA|nr:BAHD acyltransferase [Morus notabilis]